jgi:hypothetical protein
MARCGPQAYHDRMLAIGDGKQGWTMTEVDRTTAMKRTLEMAQRSIVSEDEGACVAVPAIQCTPLPVPP